MACNRFSLYIVCFLNSCNFSIVHVTVFLGFNFEQKLSRSTDIIHDFPANVNNPKGSFSSRGPPFSLHPLISLAPCSLSALASGVPVAPCLSAPFSPETLVSIGLKPLLSAPKIECTAIVTAPCPIFEGKESVSAAVDTGNFSQFRLCRKNLTYREVK